MFGTHPWHWYVLTHDENLVLSLFLRYFSQGTPVMLFTLFPSYLIGGLIVNSHKSLYFISLLYIVIHRLVIS